jgi:L-alanine-DL-glutamate epimerase-like enolase superfamily enzyme
MQITSATAIPTELKLSRPIQMAGMAPIASITAIFVKITTVKGQNAWGCVVAHPDLTGYSPNEVLESCQKAATLAPDLHPLDIEYSLAQLAPIMEGTPIALAAFDMAFHDLLGLETGLPLYKLLGGYRHRIQTSVTIPLSSVKESVELARGRVAEGFRMLKIKGGVDSEEDVRRVRAIHRSFPSIILRLDPDGGYGLEEAVEVARTLEDVVEMIEQPTPADDLESMREITRHSPVPILADQSVMGPSSALEIAANRNSDGLCVKIACCGGLGCARQMDAIARAAKLSLMVSCVIEPALLIAAGLHFALSSPNIRYADLDGHLNLAEDPTVPGFVLQEGWLISRDVPGLGCTINLDG